ncbi:MAG: ABC transporter ATP-binding protein [Alphaproteobacteria bacterium]|nr:ABC transporter ATP-binding protein [Alphaproteobacteria bacterium]
MAEPASQAASAPQSPSLTATGLGLAYGGRAVFQDLALTLQGGEITCLLGPSGVGKSSLLRLIAGLGASGAVGQVSAGDGQPLVGRVAFMDQRDLLLPWLNVLGNVTLGQRLRGQPIDAERALAMLRAVGLAEVAGLWPAALSGGMRQRAALARTLMEDRPFVLMDEPFSQLDALTRTMVQDLAGRLLGGRTVLLVTHDPWEALKLGHTVLVLAGNPARLGPPLRPPGPPPRPPAEPGLLALYRVLLQRLGQAPAP